MNKKPPVRIGSYVGIGLSFGTTLAVSLWLTTTAGGWLDARLGLNGIFTFLGLLLGIFSSFRILVDNIAAIERKKVWDDDEDE